MEVRLYIECNKFSGPTSVLTSWHKLNTKDHDGPHNMNGYCTYKSMQKIKTETPLSPNDRKNTRYLTMHLLNWRIRIWSERTLMVHIIWMGMNGYFEEKRWKKGLTRKKWLKTLSPGQKRTDPAASRKSENQVCFALHLLLNSFGNQLYHNNL